MAKKKTAGTDNLTTPTTPAGPAAAAARKRAAPKRSAGESAEAASGTTATGPDAGRDVAADMALTTDMPATTGAPGEDAAPYGPSYEEIAEAAYHRYLQRGGGHGNDFDDWFEAERSLRSRKNGQ